MRKSTKWAIVVIVAFGIVVGAMYVGLIPDYLNVARFYEEPTTPTEATADLPGTEVDLQLSDYEIFSLLEVLFGKSIRLRSRHKMYWLFEHYGRMYISMIAAFSAFSAIQQPFSNQIVNWLWPTLAGTIILVILGKHYDKKYNIVSKRS